jgi:chromosome segregation ATPase
MSTQFTREYIQQQRELIAAINLDMIQEPQAALIQRFQSALDEIERLQTLFESVNLTISKTVEQNEQNYTEIGRLHQEVNRLQSLVDNCKATINDMLKKNSELNHELEDTRKRFDQILNDCWGILYPGRTDWEYPGQLYNHLRSEIEKLQDLLKQLWGK